MQRTEEQRRAIEARGHSLLVEAGAGTGKTSVLVARFLALLAEQEGEQGLERLVAITFTEKAAREMRTRIRADVEARARAAPPGSPWHAHRRSLERLQVGTIHSLCARLLRENAIAARLDPRFAVLDEVEAALLREEAVAQSVAELVEGGGKALALLNTLTLRDLHEELAGLLARRGTVAPLFEALPAPDALLARWTTALDALRHTLWEAARASNPLLDEALTALPALRLPADDKLVPHVAGALDGIAAAERGALDEAARDWLDIKLNVGSAKAWGDKERLAEVKAWLRALRDGAQALDKAGVLSAIGPDDAAAATALQQWAALWAALVARYDSLKEERGVLDFDDLERLADALLDCQPRPARLHAFVSAIAHVLVDEFQDTNSVQQRLVYALAPPASGRLFVVGDAKQSIYRFRQAQVALFQRTSDDIEQAGGATSRLSRSFRTHGALVAALNVLFERLFQPTGAGYQPWEVRPGPLVAQRPAPTQHPAAPAPVELLLLPLKDEDGVPLSSQAARVQEARWLAERLLALHAAGFPIWDRAQGAYRPFQFGDAALLFRSTSDLPLYEEQFKAAALPYLTVSGRGYFERPEVQELLALLAALDNPRDDLQLATVLRSPLFSLSDETLFRLRWMEPGGTWREREPRPLAEALRAPPPTGEAAAVAHAGGVLAALWGEVGRVEVWQLLQRAVAETGYEATLALADRALGGRQRPNVQKFMELARQRGGASLSAFARQAALLRAREAREGEALADAPQEGVVQLLTIHAAKGLEFPVVGVVDLGRKGAAAQTPRLLADPAFGLLCKQRDEQGEWQRPASFRWGEWLDKALDEAEARRLLYVACTRAADLLLLAGQPRQHLAQIVEAWEVPEAGAAESLEARADFALRVYRPAAQHTAHRRRTPPPAAAWHKGPAALPPLAGPLPAPRVRPTQAASRLVRAAAEPDALLDAALRESVAPHPDHVPEATVAALVRDLLHEWEPLHDEARLRRRLAALAQQAGLSGEAALRAQERAAGRLRLLSRTPLFAAIMQGRARHPALPYSVQGAVGTLHGTLDLLWQGADGAWELVAWEPRWHDAERRAERLVQGRALLAVQSHAVQAALGTLPPATLCFLAPTVQAHHVAPPALRAAWAALAEAVP